MGPPLTAAPSPASPETHRGAFIISAQAAAPRGGRLGSREDGALPSEAGEHQELGILGGLTHRSQGPPLNRTACGHHVQLGQLGETCHLPFLLSLDHLGPAQSSSCLCVFFKNLLRDLGSAGHRCWPQVPP